MRERTELTEHRSQRMEFAKAEGTGAERALGGGVRWGGVAVDCRSNCLKVGVRGWSLE